MSTPPHLADERAPHRPPPPFARAIGGFGLLIFGASIAARKLGDFDLPLHLAVGRALWQTGHVSRVDDFSYLHGAIRYVEPFSVAGLYAAYRVAGPAGVQALGGAAALLVGVALWLQTRRFGAAAFVATSLALAAMSTFFVVRSSTVSFVLLALTLLAIDLHRRAPGTPRGRRALAAFVGIELLWANAHGSAVVGLVVYALYFAHRLAARLARGRASSWLPERDGTDVGPTGAALGVAFAAATLNPAGPRILLGPLRFDEDLSVFTEWARPTWAFYVDHEALAGLAFAVALVAAVLGRDPDTGNRQPPLFDAAVAALGLAFAAAAVRLVPLAVLLVTPWNAGRWARSAPRSRLANGVCAGLLWMSCAPVLLGRAAFGVGFDTSHLPEGPARWAETHQPEGHLWNPAPFGGYLAWRLYPGTRILMDGRNVLAHDRADVILVDASEHDPAAFDEAVRRYDLDWAVTRVFEGADYGDPLARASGWAMVWLDDVAAVYVKRDGLDARWAADGYRVINHRTQPGRVLSMAAGGVRAQDMGHDGALAAAQAPASVRAAFFDACGAIAVRDAGRLQRARDRISALAPGHPALLALSLAWNAAPGPVEEP